MMINQSQKVALLGDLDNILGTLSIHWITVENCRILLNTNIKPNTPWPNPESRNRFRYLKMENFFIGLNIQTQTEE